MASSRSSQPCSSSHTNGLVGQRFPKLEENFVQDDEMDDDVSLLAESVEPDSEAEEDEEVDDVSLLAAEMMSEPETRQGEVVDYLEGMTAKMFGEDDEFEQCGIHNEEKDVEALPDAHYGLLGTSTNLLCPQGCIDDLPEEVLRQVLSKVPAHDLYRNVSLVCHHWRHIVQDPKVNQTTTVKSQAQ